MVYNLYKVKMEAESESEEEDELSSSTMEMLKTINNGGGGGHYEKDNCIRLGKTFKSFEEVSQAIREYEVKNQVQLTAKYFRRIAANPKPSNKEDYMLTVEERKCFVYRWVDFCCPYFDGRIAPPLEPNGDTRPTMGYAVKECPMRIRFQLRSAEKDIIVNTFNEAHDHQQTDSGQESCTLPSAYDTTQGTPLDAQTANTKIVSELSPNIQFKAATRPPPSLNVIPTATSSNALVQTITPLQKSQSRGSLPKPPPLKRAVFGTTSSTPSVIRQQDTDTQTTNHLSAHTPAPALIVGTSTRTIISNIYNYLSRIKTEGSSPNGIGFVSSSPNFAKIISEMTGINERLILEIIQGKIRNSTLPNNRACSSDLDKSEIHSHQNTVNMKTLRKGGIQIRGQYQNDERRSQNLVLKRRVMLSSSGIRSAPYLNFRRISKPNTAHSNLNENRNVYQQQYQDKDDFPSQLPLEVIIKSEPDPEGLVNSNEDEYMEETLSNNTFNISGNR